MVRTIAPLALFAFVVLHSQTTHADRTYKVYKANEFGRKSVLADPEAVIKVDELTGEAKVYEPNLFGEADTIEGPKYVIESDSLFVGNHHPQVLHGFGGLHHEHERMHDHYHDHDTDDGEWEEE